MAHASSQSLAELQEKDAQVPQHWLQVLGGLDDVSLANTPSSKIYLPAQAALVCLPAPKSQLERGSNEGPSVCKPQL